LTKTHFGLSSDANSSGFGEHQRIDNMLDANTLPAMCFGFESQLQLPKRHPESNGDASSSEFDEHQYAGDRLDADKLTAKDFGFELQPPLCRFE